MGLKDLPIDIDEDSYQSLAPLPYGTRQPLVENILRDAVDLMEAIGLEEFNIRINKVYCNLPTGPSKHKALAIKRRRMTPKVDEELFNKLTLIHGNRTKLLRVAIHYLTALMDEVGAVEVALFIVEGRISLENYCPILFEA